MENDRAEYIAPRMPTGIPGFDDIAGGGLPRNGVTVVLGGAGVGKTTFAMQVLARAAASVDLEIVNVLTDPERGLRDGIIVTPMLVKIEPPPERRLLGSLLDRPRLLAILGLDGGAHE